MKAANPTPKIISAKDVISMTLAAYKTTIVIPKTAKRRFLLSRYFPQNEIIKIKPQNGEIVAITAPNAAAIYTFRVISNAICAYQ